jgi:glutathione synthase/RimK-type ligase-like ATP-grasp enzyme
MTIAFATDSVNPQLTPDDSILRDYLVAKGLTVSTAIWEDANVNWSVYDVIVIRSTWNYYHKPKEFVMWLENISRLGCKVLNPVPVLLWNMNKKYLVDLNEKHIPVPSLHFYEHNAHVKLSNVFKSNHWQKIVIKPAVSGGGFNTWTTSTPVSDQDEERFASMLNDGDVIVQQFLKEIQDEGELSVVFFNRKYSHCVKKLPATGEFRVQAQFGGTLVKVEPDPKVLKKCIELLNAIDHPLLYARVDGVVVDDHFYLMELELIEPVLFFKHDQHACANFYRALLDLMENR